MVETLVGHSVHISSMNLMVKATDLSFHSLFRALSISLSSGLLVRLKFLLMLETRNHRILLIIVLLPGFKLVFVDSLLVLSHISIHLEGVVLCLLGVKLRFIILNLRLLVEQDTLVDEGVLLDVFLNLLLLVALDSHFVAFFSELVILHLFNQLVLVVHTLTQLLLLDKASCRVHS